MPSRSHRRSLLPSPGPSRTDGPAPSTGRARTRARRLLLIVTAVAATALPTTAAGAATPATVTPAAATPAAATPAPGASTPSSAALVADDSTSILFSSGFALRRTLGALDPATGERTYLGFPSGGRYDELRAPAVSPDQTRVALQFDPANDAQLVVLDLRTDAFTTLATSGAFPAEWLPDGSAVLAGRDVQQPDGQYSRDVWRFPVPADGTPPGAPVRLPGTRDLLHVSVDPAGETLVGAHYSGELVRQRLDGTGRVVLGRGQHPRWSPDGTLVVYSVYDPAGIGTRSLRVVEPSGQGDRLLVGAEQLAGLGVSGSTGRPSWTPDSADVLFDVTPGASPSGNGDLFRIGRDGTGLTRLTDTPDDDERQPALHLGQPSPPTVTVPATPISAGQRVTVSYRGAPGAVLEVLSRTQPATTFSRITTVTLGADGTGQTSHAPQRNTRMAARTATGLLSSTRPIIAVRSVASSNVARVGARTYQFSGRVYPARDQRLVSLYRDGRLLVQTRTGADGIYRLTRTLPAGAATYEVRTADDTWNLGTRSPSRRFTAV